MLLSQYKNIVRLVLLFIMCLSSHAFAAKECAIIGDSLAKAVGRQSVCHVYDYPDLPGVVIARLTPPGLYLDKAVILMGNDEPYTTPTSSIARVRNKILKGSVLWVLPLENDNLRNFIKTTAEYRNEPYLDLRKYTEGDKIQIQRLSDQINKWTR